MKNLRQRMIEDVDVQKKINELMRRDWSAGEPPWSKWQMSSDATAPSMCRSSAKECRLVIDEHSRTYSNAVRPPETTIWYPSMPYRGCFAASSSTVFAGNSKRFTCRNPYGKKTGSSTVNRPSRALVRSSIISPAIFTVSPSPTAESFLPTMVR